jgi:hypothetical protein
MNNVLSQSLLLGEFNAGLFKGKPADNFANNDVP